MRSLSAFVSLFALTSMRGVRPCVRRHTTGGRLGAACDRPPFAGGQVQASIGVRTLIQEEISLLTVLYFPFRERIPSSIRVQEFR
jgi:hypothetical protein